jgi:hypothetical protein
MSMVGTQMVTATDGPRPIMGVCSVSTPNCSPGFRGKRTPSPLSLPRLP